MAFTRLNDGLLADHTFAFYLPDFAAGLLDDPMPTQQLHRVGASVLNGDVVAENEFSRPGVGVHGQVLGLNADSDAVGGLDFHD